MLGSDIRDLNWQQIRDRVSGLRLAVHSALLLHGPCTTRVLAHKAGLDLLSVRPRVTELVELGFAECVGRIDGEGVYQAFTYDAAARKYSDRQAIARGEGIQTSFL